MPGVGQGDDREEYATKTLITREPTHEPLCTATEASCICNLRFEHQGPHICECEGSWGDDGEIHAMPSLVVEEGGPFPIGSRPFA